MTDTPLALARAGDSDAFGELTDPYRRELQAHCYRILGSVQDAEDILQETLVSAWRALDTYKGPSLRAWLYRIATNRVLNFLRDQSRRPQTTSAAALSGFDGSFPADDPSWLEPYPDAILGDDIDRGPEARYDAREAIALSFVAGLQQLPPLQRAVLVLRDVMGLPTSEIADMLATSPASVNSSLARARSGFRPERKPETVPLPRSPQEANLVERFVDAFQSGDLERVIALLADDAKFSMPPEPVEFRGPLAITDFLRSRGFWDQTLLLVPTRANNQPAFGYYLPDPTADIYRVSGLLVLSLEGNQISRITRFADTAVLARFGLPRTLPKTRG